MWRPHLAILQVYQDCEWSLLPIHTPKALVWMHRGIAGAEIEAVMRAHGIPKRDRLAVLRGVRTMASAAAPILNEHLKKT